MMSFQIELHPREEAVADLIASVGDQLQANLIECKMKEGLTQQSIARSLGIDRSRVNKCFSGYNNLTLKTLAELTWAMDKCVHVKICEPHQEIGVLDNQGDNFFYRPIFSEATRRPVRSKVSVRRGGKARPSARTAISF